MSNGLKAAFAVGMLGLGLAFGGAVWLAHHEDLRNVDKARAAVTQCQQELSTCSREGKSAADSANEASASLTASRAELEALRAEHAEAASGLETLKSLTLKFQKMIDSGKLQIALKHGRMVVKLPAGVLFASGSAELSKEGKDALHEVAVILKQVSDRRFMVAGHTDNLPIDPRAKSPFKDNLELSTARGLIVAEHLIASGMSGKHLVAAGYGEHEPVRENRTEAGRQENRRIEIVLMPNITELPVVPGAAQADAGAPKTTR